MSGEQQKIPRERSLKAGGQGETRELASKRAEPEMTKSESGHSQEQTRLMEEVVERRNLKQALKRVRSNKGAPGIDGMTVEELPEYLKAEWPRIKEELLAGSYEPQPVKRVEIPKPDGGVRKLGIPTVVDRFIQQALLQVLQVQWDPTFSSTSFGFRPGKSAHQAVAKAQEYIRSGYDWVVDLDLEKFFDRVNHTKLMELVSRRVRDERVLTLIRGFLRAGVMEKGLVNASDEGTPQGGPLSPLLSNVVLDELDRELEARGHRFVRYADDCNTYVRSRRAGERVMKSITRFLSRQLKLTVNAEKSAVDRPWKRKLLGFSFTVRDKRRTVAPKSIVRLKAKVREVTSRTGGKNLAQVVAMLARYLEGWRTYFGFAEIRDLFKKLDSWIRRKLRCMLWKQWGVRRYRELRARGVSQRVAWVTHKAPHGPWRISHCPALQHALPWTVFRDLGLPSLARKY